MKSILTACVFLSIAAFGQSPSAVDSVFARDLSNPSLLVQFFNLPNFDPSHELALGVAMSLSKSQELHVLMHYGWSRDPMHYGLGIHLGWYQYFHGDHISSPYIGGMISSIFYYTEYFRLPIQKALSTGKATYSSGLSAGILFFPESIFQLSVDYLLRYDYSVYPDFERHSFGHSVRFIGRLSLAKLFRE